MLTPALSRRQAATKSKPTATKTKSMRNKNKAECNKIKAGCNKNQMPRPQDSQCLSNSYPSAQARSSVICVDRHGRPFFVAGLLKN
jgi:streptogramin lyase